MKDPELLENLSKLERTSKVLEIKIKVWKDEKGKLDLIKRNEEVKAEIEKLKRNLATVSGNNEEVSLEEKSNKEPKSNETTNNSKASKTVEELKVSEEPKSNEKEKLEKVTKEEETKDYVEGKKDSGQKQLLESELLTNISELERTSKLLEIKIKVWKVEKEKQDLIQRNEEVKAEIEKLKGNLPPVKGNKERDSQEVTDKDEPKNNETPENTEEVKSNQGPETIEKLEVSEEPKSNEKEKIDEKTKEEETKTDIAVKDDGQEQVSEPEILTEISKLERTSKVLEIKIKVWKDEKEKLDLIKQNEEVKAEIEKLKSNLAPINGNKEIESRKAKSDETPKNIEVEEAKSNEKHNTVEKLKPTEEPKSNEKEKIGEETKDNKKETQNDTEVNDNIYKQLTELELLKTLSQLEKDSQDLEIKIKTENEEKGKTNWIKQNEEIKGKIKNLKTNLASINDKRYGEAAKSAIIRQLKENILEISNAGKENIEKQLFEKKFGDLYFLVAEKVSGVNAPNFSSYKTANDNPINAKELTDFLIQEIQTITNLDDPSYSNLREYLAGLKVRIIKRFIE